MSLHNKDTISKYLNENGKLSIEKSEQIRNVYKEEHTIKLPSPKLVSAMPSADKLIDKIFKIT